MRLLDRSHMLAAAKERCTAKAGLQTQLSPSRSMLSTKGRTLTMSVFVSKDLAAKAWHLAFIWPSEYKPKLEGNKRLYLIAYGKTAA